MDKNEAYKLELLDDFIDLKKDELNELNESYEFFLRKLNSFILDYSKKVNEFSESINKQIDEMHKIIDSFKTIYIDSLNELNLKRNNALKKNDEFDGDYTKDIQEVLNRKLTSEIDKLKNSSNKLLDNYLNEYKKSTDSLQKINARITKLKDRKYND